MKMDKRDRTAYIWIVFLLSMNILSSKNIELMTSLVALSTIFDV